MKYTKKFEQNLCPINLLSQKRFHLAFIPMHKAIWINSSYVGLDFYYVASGLNVYLFFDT